MHRILALVLFLCLAWPVPAAAEARLPFAPGEELSFQLYWGPFTAGTVLLRVEEPTEIRGEPANHFRMTARTTEFIDRFYKVRDVVDSYTDPGVTRALFFRQIQREGSYERDIEVIFDQANATAYYSTKNGTRRELAIAPGTLDPWSIFYYFRVVPGELTPGRVLVRPVSDGKKAVVGEATVVRREKVTVAAGTFDTVLVEPDLKHLGGVFNKSPDAKLQIWVTDDARRLPVKLRSKVVVGYFWAELLKLPEAPAPAAANP